MLNQESVIPQSRAVVTLREITKETLSSILDLRVAQHQEHFVAANAVSVAQAYFEREFAWFRGIYADETAVGFLMLYNDSTNKEYVLWRFMIDARFQGKGFGKRALELLINHVQTLPGAKSLGVSCVPGTGSPCQFYEQRGFTYTGEVEDDELVMSLDLS